MKRPPPPAPKPPSRRRIVLSNDAGVVILGVNADFNPFLATPRERQLINDIADLCDSYQGRGRNLLRSEIENKVANIAPPVIITFEPPQLPPYAGTTEAPALLPPEADHGSGSAPEPPPAPAAPPPAPTIPPRAGTGEPRPAKPPKPGKRYGYGELTHRIEAHLEAVGWQLASEIGQALDIAGKEASERCGYLHEKGRIARRPIPAGTPNTKPGATYQWGPLRLLSAHARAAVAAAGRTRT